MNKRIEELAKEHGLIHIHMSTGEYNDTLKKFEKFAELIVGECQFAIVSRTDLPRHERKLYNNVLKEHFGVQ